MSDVTVTFGTEGKDQILGDFSAVEKAGHALGEKFQEMSQKLGELFLSYEAVRKAVETFHAALEEGSRVAKFSEQTGIAADKLLVMGRAFENAGIPADELGKNINKMQRFLVEAGDEGSKAAEKLSKLGMTAEEIRGLSPDEQFRTLAKRIAEIPDPAERAAIALEIFGKAGGKTLALFGEYDENISRAGKQVGTFAEIMERNANVFHYVETSLSEMGHKAVELAAGILDKVNPALVTMLEHLEDVDAAKFGQSLGEGILYFADLVTGFFTKTFPEQISFLGDYFSMAFAKAGDDLTSMFGTAFNYAQQFFQAAFSSDLFENVGRMLLDSVILALLSIESKTLEIIEKIFEVFRQVSNTSWMSMLENVGRWLMDLFSKMGEELKAMLTHPLDYVRGKFNEMWTGSADDMEKAYNDANGDFLQKAKAGIDALADNIKGDLADSMTKSGDSFLETMNKVVSNSETFKSNIFGSKEAMDKLAQDADSMVEAGKAIREGAQSESEALKKMQEASGGSGEGLAAPGGGGSGGGGRAAQPILSGSALNTGMFKNTSGMSYDQQADLYNSNSDINGTPYSKSMQDYVSRMTQQGAGGGAAAAEAQRKDDMAQRALLDSAYKQTVRDFSDYSGSSGNANAQDSIRALADQIGKDSGMSFKDSMDQAWKQFSDQVDKNMGPQGSGADDVGSKAQAAADAAKEAVEAIKDSGEKTATILTDIKSVMNTLLTSIDKKLPIYALS